MGYIHTIQTNDNNKYLIEPLLFATVTGTPTALQAEINNFELFPGVYVHLKVGTVSANATLDINNSGNPKKIFYNNIRIGSGMLSEGNIYTFVYDGINWNITGDITGKNILIGTTQEWVQHYDYVAPMGTIVIFTDHGNIQTTINGQEITQVVPSIKITDGSTPIIDLPFVGDDQFILIQQELSSHIEDNIRHITAAEREKWNHKITCEDAVDNNNLILTRN